jgi:hypothetical protein
VSGGENAPSQRYRTKPRRLREAASRLWSEW